MKLLYKLLIILCAWLNTLLGQNFDALNFKRTTKIVPPTVLSSKSNSISPISNIGKNIQSSFSDLNIFYFIAGVGLTYLTVETGIDADMLENIAKLDKDFSESIGHSGIYIGYLVPMIIPAAMYLQSGENSELRTGSYALMQSVGVAVGMNTFLKAITGRKPPLKEHNDKDKLSREFRFGFLRGGIHYGWPSGHLMTNTALVTTLSALYPEKTWIRYASYTYISLLAASIAIHGEAHWLSEIVAGGLMGYAIGKVIGEDFYQMHKSQKRKAKEKSKLSFKFIPVIGSQYSGVTFSMRF
jgi:membrane-associated phospholipid phosphatase